MTKTTNLVLAAGEASRWDGPGLKQLLPVDGESLVHRICRHVKGAVIVTAHQEIADTGLPTLRPDDFSGTCKTLLSTIRVWKNRVNVWLGDVWYTDTAFDLILACEKEIMFFGDGSEIFAVSFSNKIAMMLALMAASDSKQNEGRIWEAYRALYGLEWPLKAENAHYTMLLDGTTDFDTHQKYLDWTKARECLTLANQSPIGIA